MLYYDALFQFANSRPKSAFERFGILFAQAFRRKSSRLRSSRKTKIRNGNTRTRSRCLNNGKHGLRFRFACNSKIIELTTYHGATDLWMKSNQIDRRFSFRAIWNRKLKALSPIAFLTVVVWLCSCDANLFGPESREIAGGYRLKQANNLNEVVSCATPHESGLRTIPNPNRRRSANL